MHKPKLASRTARTMYAIAQRTGILRTRGGDAIFSRTYMLYKRYLEDQLDGLVRKNRWIVRQGHVFDVGANIGYTALLWSRFIDEGFAVHAFEPEPENVWRLRRNIERYRAKSIVVHACAAGATEGTVRLSINAIHQGDHRVMTSAFEAAYQSHAVIEVPMTTIDSAAARWTAGDHVALVKIDVQGYESEVLAGMRDVLGVAIPPVVVFEHDQVISETMGFDPAAVPQFLRERGFVLYLIGDDGALIEAGEPFADRDDYFDVVAIHRATAAFHGVGT